MSQTLRRDRRLPNAPVQSTQTLGIPIPGACADAARRTGIIRLVPQREEPHRTRTFFGHTRGALCDTLASWDAI
jgi:hypothetical protein